MHKRFLFIPEVLVSVNTPMSVPGVVMCLKAMLGMWPPYLHVHGDRRLDIIHESIAIYITLSVSWLWSDTLPSSLSD